MICYLYEERIPKFHLILKYIYHELSIDKQITISMTEIISIYIDKNSNQVFGVPNYDNWGEIDTNDDLKLYER